jgi:sterol desaturase/sphingolipid hydroxylase (fatty acid hydroxylase superfamily)
MKIINNPLTILIVLAFIVIEAGHSRKEHKELYDTKDSASSFLMGFYWLMSNFLSNAILFGALQMAWKFRVFDLGNTWPVWMLTFFSSDLSTYWYHRMSHEVNWFWATHLVHHSSRKMNISTTFRLPVMSQLTGQFLFWMWIPVLGMNPFMTFIFFKLCYFYQTWLHTEAINKLPRVIEYVFNTPSHHRVHHGCNPEYLDKNHGAVLIIWDRIFKTFCEETIKPTYGLTADPESINPFMINFIEYKTLFQKALKAGSPMQAINYFIKAPGWSHNGETLTVKEMRKNAALECERVSKSHTL